MPYITVEELKLRFPETATFGDSDEDIEDFLVAPAEAEIDARFCGFYEVPFVPAPPLVKDLVLSLAHIKALESFDVERAQKLRAILDAHIQNLTTGTEQLMDATGRPLAKMRTVKVWTNTAPGVNIY